MIEKVKQGIIDKLYELYGDKYDYVDHDIEQGFDNSTFVIKCEKLDKTKYLDIRYNNNHLMSISFFPKKQDYKDIESELSEVRESIWQALEYIDITNNEVTIPARGILESEAVSDNVLVMAVSYDMATIIKSTEDISMDNLEVRQ